jgi:uncharacterized coiled-coil protein SlyX
MATAAAMPLHHFKDDDTCDHDVGMSLSPSPSPHTTLTPIQAAQLSAQVKEAVDSSAAEQPLEVEEQGTSSALVPRPTENLDTFLTPTGALNISGVVSQDNMNSANNRDTSGREHQLESRIAQLEQKLASLTEVCNGLVEQQQVRTEFLDGQVRDLVQQMVREDLASSCLSCHQVSCAMAAIYRVAS